MDIHEKALAAFGVCLPRILLPAPGIDPSLWAVVACDQYSSEREYWDEVGRIVGDAPSTLRLIYPECYLEDDDKTLRIASIQKSMRSYLDAGYLRTLEPGFVLVERRTPFMDAPRIGLVMAVDLEHYRYGSGSRSPIRPTEGTIVERLPPRMEIRRGAALELPHIMLLVDDPENRLLGPLWDEREHLPLLYDFELMKNAGRVRGWEVCDDASLARMEQALSALADRDAFAAKYGSTDLLLFAVGDGNHSLATAKAIWEETKASLAGNPELLASHPARFALVELVNIYDEGLPFHPIHRLLFSLDEKAFFQAAVSAGAQILTAPGDGSFAAAAASVDAPDKDPAAHSVAWVSSTGTGILRFPAPKASLAAGTIQSLVDAFRTATPGCGIDYIHGTESLLALATKPGNLGLYLPPVDKAGFFGTVVREGVMPRKTFSMGEAPEKRFYIEARAIVPDLSLPRSSM